MKNTKIENLKPVLNLEQLQQKANEYAQKGAEDVIKEFYNGYDSPYKRAIVENLKSKGIDDNFDIPDIVAVLNQKLSIEVDTIANTAIAKTFIPLVKKFLTREEANVKFSDILRNFIEHTGFNNDDFCISDYKVTKVEKESGSSSLNDTFPAYQITNGKDGFELHFYRDEDKLTVMSLPYTLTENKKYYGNSYDRNEKMKLSLDGGASLELPFTRGILENNFVRFCARLVIGNSNIILDVEDFEEEMFPEKEYHC